MFLTAFMPAQSNIPEAVGLRAHIKSPTVTKKSKGVGMIFNSLFSKIYINNLGAFSQL